VGVKVRQYIDELALILIDNFIIVSNFKKMYNQEKTERLYIRELIVKLQQKKSGVPE
jgi:hypothetical protein